MSGKTWLAASAVLFCASVARADTFEDRATYTVVFSFVRFGPDGQLEIAGSTSDALPVSLPPSLSEGGWRCERRPQVEHGNLAHQGLACVRQGFEVGVGVTCPTDDVGTDDQTFWLRPTQAGEHGVIFVGHCASLRNRVDDGF